jgi:signal transduction histidine kinase
VERIGRLVGQLLDLSRADALHVETIDSKEFFEELALFARMAVKKKNCVLEVADGFPRGRILLDRDRIHQTVLNLVLNAADARDHARPPGTHGHADRRRKIIADRFSPGCRHA